jgi:hypothetical protein
VADRFTIVAIRDRPDQLTAHHALPLGQGTDAEHTLCSIARPAEGWITSGYTSMIEMIGCDRCRDAAKASLREAYPLG